MRLHRRAASREATTWGPRRATTGPLEGTVDLDASVAALGHELGKNYPLDFFFAERHLTGSSFRFTTSLTFTDCGGGPTWCVVWLRAGAGQRARDRERGTQSGRVAILPAMRSASAMHSSMGLTPGLAAKIPVSAT